MPARLDDEPPPSTYAAQIVHNLEGSKARPDTGGSKPKLRELFKRVLDLEENGLVEDETIERNLPVNHKLIWTIVRGCLQLHGERDPFENRNEVIELARNGLAVIEVTVKRNPDVLISTSPAEASYKAAEEPLFLWLIPHMLSLLHIGHDRDVRQGAKKVLDVVLLVQGKKHSIKGRLSLMLRYIQGCIDDTLRYLVDIKGHLVSRKSFRSPGIPSSETVQNTTGFTLSRDSICRVQAEDAQQTISLIISTLSVLQNWSSSTQKAPSANLIRWFVKSFSDLQIVLDAIPESEFLQQEGIYISHLKIIMATCTAVRSYSQDSVQMYEMLRLLCQSIGSILQRSTKDTTFPVSENTEDALAEALYLICLHAVEIPTAWKAYKQHLEPFLHSLSPDALSMLGSRLNTLKDLVTEYLSGGIRVLPEDKLNDCKSTERELFRQLFVKLIGDDEVQGSPPSKRLREDESASDTERPHGGGFRSAYLNAIGFPLNCRTGLPELISENLASLPEETQCSLVAMVGREACHASGAYRGGVCQFCDQEDSTSVAPLLEPSESLELAEILVCIVRITQEQKTPKPRVHAMLTLRYLFAHCNDISFMDLRTSTLAAWPLQSLKSSIRALRIASVGPVLHLLSSRLPQTIVRANRICTLDVLRTLADKDLVFQEIAIMTYGRIATTIQSEEEINLCLIRLVEYLGHSNPMVTHLAYEELQRLCSHSSNTAMRLFEPYWRTLAVVVVKDLQRRPQICQTVCDLLGINVSNFLKLTQYHTIPYLIMRRQRDTLRRIGEANGSNTDLLEICSNSDQLAVILAHILLQPSEDPEGAIIALLSQVSDQFSGADPQELLRSDPTRIAFELLQIASDADEDTKSRARHGIIVLAEKTQRKPSKKYSAVDIFFEESSLGIMQLLSEVVSQIKGAQPLGNRRRCVGAIEEMSIIAGHHLLNALPQISSCLRSAIEDKDLCNEAFGAWMVLMKSIDREDEVETLIAPTFAIVARHWDSFSSSVQQAAHDMIGNLITTHGKSIHDSVLSTPSLEGIPLLSKFEAELNTIRQAASPSYRYEAFAERCLSDNGTVVSQALSELPTYLLETQSFIHQSVASEQPDPAIGFLIKALLDVCVRFTETRIEIASEAARCLGLIGCLDPNKIELPHEEREMFVLSDFANSDETLEFAIFFLEEVLVKIFLSETDTRNQGLLAYAIQELLKTCGFEPRNTINRVPQPDGIYTRWRSIDEPIRDTLAPFLSSRYVLEPLASVQDSTYPIYRPGMNHSTWLRQIVFDLLGKSVGRNATVIFSICRRIVRRQNIAIPAFLLPFITLHVCFQGRDEQIKAVLQEFMLILGTPLTTDQADNENLLSCSQDVFRCLDYMTKWLRQRKKTKKYLPRVGVTSLEDAHAQEMEKLAPVEQVLDFIPAEVISDRAVQCKNFARALLHWEAHIREKHEEESSSRQDMDSMYSKLQNIYNSIDEPDGIEGISSRIVSTSFEQQMLEHRKAGRWSALQSWYELEVNRHSQDPQLQLEFLRSLKESGQHDTLINEFASLKTNDLGLKVLTPLVTESAWTTGRWAILEDTLSKSPQIADASFEVGIGRLLLNIKQQNAESTRLSLDKLREDAVRHLTTTNARSLESCHEIILQLQILSEIQELAGMGNSQELGAFKRFASSLLSRVDSLGPFPSEKQKVLSLQRAVVHVASLDTDQCKLSKSWLVTAKLARKSGFTHQAFNAFFQASHLGEKAAAIEDARLLWSDGHHIKAIHNLKAAIQLGAFGKPGIEEATEARKKLAASTKFPVNPVAASAHLLLAKWIDHAGQSQSEAIIEQYRNAVDLHNRVEKGHYLLGRHYNKLLESERAKPHGKQNPALIKGEMAKLVIESYLRASAMGCKYVHETIPRILTLWLELGLDLKKAIDPRYGNEHEFQRHLAVSRAKNFKVLMTSMKKYLDRLPPYIWYTAFAQVLARICHPNDSIQSSLVDIVARVVGNLPQQATWSLLALIKSKNQEDRLQRGKECWVKVTENAKKMTSDKERQEMLNLLRQGQRISDQLLALSQKDLGKRHGIVSLANDLGFSHSKSSHCGLAIPVEAMLTAVLPTAKGSSVRTHVPFPRETVTIDTFLDEVLVLNSLIKPKKVSIRGSDGRIYGILCKPKDDLRKDQRLLEFNSMITRLLKRDAQSSKRKLYIKTYAVTPLNEECGLIEWVDGVRTLRDILLDIYKSRNVHPNYGSIREILDVISANRDEVGRFETEVLNGFPPVFKQWFTEMFPEPNAWFAARLRYTRSCAVMSMVGHVLGLGDRHGENILFQSQDGGTLHVDYNCLFDKGFTFDKPERVPFRLTHNMVDAFGVYGYEGPFRKSCELTMGILRQHEHALMTILETFVHDPTTDFIGQKRKANPIVPDTPEGVLEAIRTKVRGLIQGESVPLSVEGHVQLLIHEAVDHFNLASMYIGWCAFL